MIPKMGNEVLITEIQLCLPRYCVSRVPCLLREPPDECMVFCVLVASLVMLLVMTFIQDERYVQDIDTLQDWEIAEMKYQLLRGRTV